MLVPLLGSLSDVCRRDAPACATLERGPSIQNPHEEVGSIHPLGFEILLLLSHELIWILWNLSAASHGEHKRQFDCLEDIALDAGEEEEQFVGTHRLQAADGSQIVFE